MIGLNTKMYFSLMTLGVAFFLLLPLAAADPQDATPPKKRGAKKGGSKKAKPDASEEDAAVAKQPKKWTEVRLQNTSHPSVRMGDWLRVDFRLRLMHDFRAFDPELSGDEGETSNLRQLRVGLQGYVTKDIEFEVDREIRNEIGELLRLRTNPTSTLWRDVFVNYRRFRRFQVRAGQFKIPFGADQLHSTASNEFAFRSLIGNYLAPGRDIGVMVHGKLFKQRLEYQAGVFRHDGRRIRQVDDSPSGDRTIAGRLVTAPFSWVKPPRLLGSLKDLELGAAFTQSYVPEGLSSPRGRTWYGTHNYFPRVNIQGQRWRTGVDLDWTPGPFSLRAEVIQVSDERLGQSLRGGDLSNLISRGWYLSGSWVLTGEAKDRNVTPRRDFGWAKGKFGFGAVEIAARGEQIRFGSAEHIGLPSRSTRAANLVSASERAATFGVNWYLNRRVKVLFNGVREQIEDREKTPIRGVQTYWSKYVRIQFAL